ncbi:GSK3B-interacting protein-like [Battus philenor]|uniref:GSK3B-interacting protein-like n=1 Tax=Battus philenor TaxID=42288 RepID=UPI0035CF1A38
MTEQVLDRKTWPLEAEAALNDIRKHVKEAIVDPDVRSTNQKIYLKITTYEDDVYTIEMSASGFRVASTQSANQNRVQTDVKYETLYALLDNTSEMYRESFGEELTTKLRDLERKRQG